VNWEKFKDRFHPSWHESIEPFIESKECDEIYAFLKSESKRGKLIAPLSSDTYRCFLETPLNEVKIIFIGLCPYHVTYNGSPIADGLFMGCSYTNKLQPTLENFYKAIEKEIYGGLALDRDMCPDVSYLAHQGILMCNAALTTEIGKAGSHLSTWEPFMKYLISNVFSKIRVPIVFFGKEASKLSKYVPIFNLYYTVSHPASASYMGGEWSSDGVFNKLDNYLDFVYNEKINWLKKD
jgi:uracil-DNA glycosylase